MKLLRQCLSGCLEYGRSLHASHYTLRTQKYHAQAFLNWLESHHQVTRADQLRAEHLEAWVNHLAGRNTCRGHPLKPRTINKQIDNVRTFLKYLARHGWIAPTLPKGLESVKVPQL